MTENKNPNAGSPRKRYPDLYYGHTYFNKDMFEMVQQFADWENLPIKAATHHLLRYGLHFYSIQQLRMEQARLNQRIATRAKVYSLEELRNILSHVGKAKKLMAKEVEPPSNT